MLDDLSKKVVRLCDLSIKNATMLLTAENCLRDIRERVEHAGTSQQGMDDIKKICDNYWGWRNSCDK